MMENKPQERFNRLNARIGQLASTRCQLAAQVKNLSRRIESIDIDLASLMASAGEADMGARDTESLLAVLQSLQAPEPEKKRVEPKKAEAKVVDVAKASRKRRRASGPL